MGIGSNRCRGVVAAFGHDQPNILVELRLLVPFSLPSPGHERAMFVCTSCLIFLYPRRPSFCAHSTCRHHQPSAGGAQLTYGRNDTAALGTDDNAGTSGFFISAFIAEIFSKEGLNPPNGEVPG